MVLNLQEVSRLDHIKDAFSNNNPKLEAFINQCQTNFTNISQTSKEIHQELQDHRNDIENSLKQFQLELEHNQPLLAKWMTGSNTKLRAEQISQMRINLSNNAKLLINKLQQMSQEIDNYLNQFTTTSQELTANFISLQNQIDFPVVQGQAVTQQGNIEQVLQQAIEALNIAMQGMEQRRVFEQINKSIDNLIN